MNYKNLSLIYALIALYDEYKAKQLDFLVPVVNSQGGQSIRVYALSAWVADRPDDVLRTLASTLPKGLTLSLSTAEEINDFRQQLIAMVEIGFPCYPKNQHKTTYTRRHTFVCASGVCPEHLPSDNTLIGDKTVSQWLDDDASVEDRKAQLLQVFRGMTEEGGQP